ncbi:hypothetical protein CS0771_15920 [Catellatospora sp. IY07-71]|uniref:hypothetical protein n=1 Tax=Catellatospora sp. IY07-71 TaxID=2728827 RepID=UPI001BB35322|nr:hypothetical protein [Catellatospora sp. IY07-71]BCJ72048.1 hypothetical protein CS0771_15920 [Catellatospora sp. IY07-71]
MPTNRRAAQLLDATCSALTETIARHMPAGPYRDFTAWAYSPANPRRHEYLQSTGVIQLVTMNTRLLSGLVDEDDWPTMLRFAGQMNAYQVFEVVSDDLGIGLGQPDLDLSRQRRRDLIGALNRAMLQALLPDRRTPAVLLLSGPAREAARHASRFEQSLVGGKLAGMAEEYTRHVGGAAPLLLDVEYGLWAALVTNVESCRDLVDTVAGLPTGSLVRQGLADRYGAVERTLRAEHVSRLELATLGGHTILVVPTLGYLVCVLNDVLAPVPAHRDVLADGSLSDLLADAALLVRLQNDIGTRLLRLPPVQQGALLNRIALACQRSGRESTEDAIAMLAAGDDPDHTFNRLQKDILNGEANVALWHARRAPDATSALAALADSLAYYSGLYALHSARLAAGLAALDARLKDRRASAVVERFVRFHERMYSHAHTDPLGEYAV